MDRRLLLIVLFIMLMDSTSGVELRAQAQDTSDLGVEFQVDMNVPETVDVKDIVFVLEFNPEVLQVTTVETGEFLNISGYKELSSYNNTEGQVIFIKTVSSGSAETSGDAARITFNSIASGTSTLEIQKSLMGVGGQPINVTEYKDVITIGTGLVGDMDNSDEVSLSEVIDYISLWSQEQVELSSVIDAISNWAA